MTHKTQELIILTSPPATGKTFWIHSLKTVLGVTTFLVVSPLRALADECRNKWGEEIQVVTPEQWFRNKTFAEIVIFDEFHLHFYWGDTFRPIMWEMFYEVSERAHLTFLLTATLSEEMRHEVSLFRTHFDSILWVDQGNQKLHHRPQRYIKAPSKKWIRDVFKNERKNGEVKLIFCQYREEVFKLENELSQLGYDCLSCVGGESKHMAQKLQINPRPDFIISTTVLSHGVNLPAIRKIYFTYEVSNIDFWIQMVARGGRRGDSYEVFALENPYNINWNRWVNTYYVLVNSVFKFFTPFQF